MAPWLNIFDLKDCETGTLYIYYLVSFMSGGFVNGQVQKYQSHAVKYITVYSCWCSLENSVWDMLGSRYIKWTTCLCTPDTVILWARTPPMTLGFFFFLLGGKRGSVKFQNSPQNSTGKVSITSTVGVTRLILFSVSQLCYFGPPISPYTPMESLVGLLLSLTSCLVMSLRYQSVWWRSYCLCCP